ncbi:lysosomal L-cystine transporter [Aspergillus bombycis]|uniref:Lysosomal L-cystine transporter n=1 Tax=Aspergillus bombycis TaxID=109264 RepID=A0A1F8AA26_9EURO|nr:lysosomal L-cystine transporter [Aspergillus bombycis]OGM48582.1 lysosomal L-cystine transporter [Aspergillus bombycis]
MLNDTWTQSLSQILGWAYFVLWSLSFYPQLLHNHRRRSTEGFSVDFALLNLLGLTAYTVFNACFLFSPVVRTQYAQRYPQSPEPTVQWNDFIYALHGSLICCWIGSHFPCARFWNFKSKPQRVGVSTLVAIWGCVGVVSLAVLWALVSASWEWIDVVRERTPTDEITTLLTEIYHMEVYVVGMIKVFLTAVKYTPQVVMNYWRQSTAGFSIGAILLDLAGAALSLMQLVLDSSLQADWSGTVGNGAKLLLGNITVLFDLIFIFQHFGLYRERPVGKKPGLSEHDPLLDR